MDIRYKLLEDYHKDNYSKEIIKERFLKYLSDN